MTQEQLRMQMLAGIITEGQYKDMLNENKTIIYNTQSKSQLINESFEDLIQQLAAMAEKGEISNDEIKSVEYKLMSARRRGQSNTRKASPDYSEKKAASIAQAVITRDQNKKSAADISSKFDAREKEILQVDQERRATNKLPLSIDTYGKGVKGTQKILGDFAKYYTKVFIPAGPGGENSTDLKLKPQFNSQSFDSAKEVWNFYDGI
jgi:hypothetical protein